MKEKNGRRRGQKIDRGGFVANVQPERMIGSQKDLRLRLIKAREELGHSATQFGRLTAVKDYHLKESGGKAITLLDLYRVQEFVNIEWLLFGVWAKRPDEMDAEERKQLPEKLISGRKYMGRLTPPMDWGLHESNTNGR